MILEQIKQIFLKLINEYDSFLMLYYKTWNFYFSINWDFIIENFSIHRMVVLLVLAHATVVVNIERPEPHSYIKDIK